MAPSESPHIFVFDASSDEHDAAGDLASNVSSLGVAAPFVIASAHGMKLASALSSADSAVIPPPGSNKHYATALGSRVRRAGADAVVAVGGGRVLDVAKLAAARAGLTVIVAPTQLSHDGICSPVAVVPDEVGLTQSLAAIAPRVVYLSMPTLVKAPLDSVRAGLGDLMANPLALRDWALAADRGLATIDQTAWDLSVSSFEMVQDYVARDIEEVAGDPRFLRRLADALVLSGMSMIRAGTSRPASGGEHEISHAIDAIFGGRALHGAQVAFGCIFSLALYGEDVAAFRRQLQLVGLPHHPEQLGLSFKDTASVLLGARSPLPPMILPPI